MTFQDIFGQIEQVDGFLNTKVEEHERRLLRSLRATERKIISLAQKLKTDKDGKILGPKWTLAQAQEIHGKLRKVFEDEYGVAVGQLVKDFDEVNAAAKQLFDEAGITPKIPKGFAAIEQEMLEQAKSQAFKVYDTLSLETENRIAQSVYDSVVAGQSFGTLSAQISAAIVGYADIKGRPLSMYAGTYAHDSLMEYYSGIHHAKAEAAGLAHYLYYGNTVRDSRPFCVARAGKVYTKNEIEAWQGLTWKGQKPGNIWTTRGGYRCRHHFVAVDPDWLKGDEIPVQKWQATGPKAEQLQLEVSKQLEEIANIQKQIAVKAAAEKTTAGKELIQSYGMKPVSELKQLAKAQKIQHWQFATKDELIAVLAHADDKAVQAVKTKLKGKYEAWAAKQAAKKQVAVQAVELEKAQKKLYFNELLETKTKKDLVEIAKAQGIKNWQWASKEELATVISKFDDDAVKLAQAKMDAGKEAWKVKYGGKKPAAPKKPKKPKVIPEEPVTATEPAGWELPEGEWKEVPNTKLGTNPGGKFMGPDGNTYYVKFYENAEQARTELLAHNLGQALGVETPQIGLRMFEWQGQRKLGIASRWLDDVTPVRDLLTKKWAADDMRQVTRHYLMTVLDANWDVVGSQFDNLVRTKAGKWICIDKGGSMWFRAQGGAKAFEKAIAEWDSLLLQGRQAGKVFSKAIPQTIQKNADEYIKWLEDLTDKRVKQLVAEAGLKPETAQTIIARRKLIIQKLGDVKVEKEFLKDIAADLRKTRVRDHVTNQGHAQMVELIMEDAKAAGVKMTRTKAEQVRSAFSSFCGSDCTNIREAARTGNMTSVAGEKWTLIEDYLDIAPRFPEKHKLYRGMRAKRGAFDQFKVGDQWEIGAPSSFSTSQSTARSFARSTKESVILEIMGGTDFGTTAMPFSNYATEREVLLSGRHVFRILKKFVGTDGYLHVQLKVDSINGWRRRNF